jgi:hypothetical protein
MRSPQPGPHVCRRPRPARQSVRASCGLSRPYRQHEVSRADPHLSVTSGKQPIATGTASARPSCPRLAADRRRHCTPHPMGRRARWHCGVLDLAMFVVSAKMRCAGQCQRAYTESSADARAAGRSHVALRPIRAHPYPAHAVAVAPPHTCPKAGAGGRMAKPVRSRPRPAHRYRS